MESYEVTTRPCVECGATRRMSRKAAREYDSGKTSGKCRDCLYTWRIEVTQAMKRYWRHPAFEEDGRKIHDGFTIDQIKVLAAELEPLLGDGSRQAKPRLHDGERQQAA